MKNAATLAVTSENKVNPTMVMTTANKREAVVVGVSNRLEIWPAEEWDRYHASKIGAYLDGSLNPQGER